MLVYLAVMVAGTLAGVVTGLVPGLHPNTVVFTSIPLYFRYDEGFMVYMSFVAGLSVSHTFHDFLPAIFLGAPEAEAALSTLPGQKMALEGRGLEAFMYTVAGGAFSVLVILVLLPLVVLVLPGIYPLLKDVMFFLLVFVLSFMIFRSRRFIPALTVVALSGALGVISFRMPVNQNFVLLPVFTGLFAVPSLYHAARSDFSVPPQQRTGGFSTGKSLRGGVTGFLAGLIAGIVPGVGAAASTSLLSPLISSRKEFLAGMGGVNTSDILVSFTALYLLGTTRSGASVALKSLGEVTAPMTVFLVGLSLVSASLSLVVAPVVAERFVVFLEEHDFSKFIYIAALVLLSSTMLLTGLPGLLVMATSSFIGYAALVSRQRSLAISVLLVPAILFYARGIFM